MILDKIVESTKIRVNKIYENENVNKIKEDAIELAKNDKDKYRFEKSLKTKPIAFICGDHYSLWCVCSKICYSANDC